MPNQTPPLPALRSFAELTRLGSVSAVADELGLTQSAIAHQIRSLEALLDVSLVRRTGRSLTLTEEGRIYGYQVRRALEDIAFATESVKKIGPRKLKEPLVRVAVLPSFAYGWLLPRLPNFYKRHPEIRLVFHGSMEYVDMKTGVVDCAIRFGHGNWPDAVVRPLLSDSLLLVSSPELLAGRVDEALESLLRLPVLHSVESWASWLASMPNYQSDIHRPKILMEFTDSTHLLEAARVGLGIALTRRSISDKLLRSGELVKANNHVCLHSSKYYTLVPSGKEESQATMLFLQWLMDECAQYASEEHAAV